MVSSENSFTSISRNQKQKSVQADSATDSSPPPTAKQRRLERQLFWDNLSRLWLTPRALREFDRRTVWPAAPLPPEYTEKEEVDLVRLKRFARQGGPSLDNLRDYSRHKTGAPSNRTMDSTQSDCGKRSSPYDGNFEQILVDSGIYPANYDAASSVERPNNWEEISARLASPRTSLSPSGLTNDNFLDFLDILRSATNESEIMMGLIPIIAGTNIRPKLNTQFGNLKELTKRRLTKARPDFWDGSLPEELDEGIRQDLSPLIVPSKNTTLPCLPNFFLEVKGEDGNFAVCNRQILYDGALGARGIHELRLHIDQETPYDGNAYTIVACFYGSRSSGMLQLYTIHPTPPGKGNRKYDFRMTLLGFWCLALNLETFRQGVTAFRNAREWAQEKRTELIAAANQHRVSQ